eukprot:12891222-Ditylum_brightwellii.AAC.1
MEVQKLYMACLDGSLQTMRSNCGREKAVHMVIPTQCNRSEQKVQDFLQHSASSTDISNTTTSYLTMNFYFISVTIAQ